MNNRNAETMGTLIAGSSEFSRTIPATLLTFLQGMTSNSKMPLPTLSGTLNLCPVSGRNEKVSSPTEIEKPVVTISIRRSLTTSAALASNRTAPATLTGAVLAGATMSLTLFRMNAIHLKPTFTHAKLRV